MGALSKLKIVDTRSVSFPLQSYFIASNGNDNNNGTTIDTPWQTLTKVNATTFSPGDHVFFRKGDTFYGSITINQSGTSIAPITFSSYGTGVNPIITGFTSVTAWTDKNNNIWESTNAVSTLSTCNMVTIGGVNTAMGQYSNNDVNGYLYATSTNGNTNLTNSALSSSDWIGADVVIRSNTYTLRRLSITAQSAGQISWSENVSIPTGVPFFIQNSINCLTYQNAWYFNPTTKKISIYSTTMPTNVKVSTIVDLVTFGYDTGSHYSNSNYVTIQNLTFEGADYAFLGDVNINSSHLYTGQILTNCEIRFIGVCGMISCKSSSNIITNNYFHDLNGNGLTTSSSSNVLISNNIFTNIAVNKGMCLGNVWEMVGIYGWSSVINVSSSINATVSYNKITNCGYDGINFSGQSTNNAIINHNYIDTFCTVLSDGGAIYGNINATITNNIILNGGPLVPLIGIYDPWAVGIYLDDNSSNNEVAYNTIYNSNRVGIYLHNSYQNNIHDNISFNAKLWQIYINNDNSYPGIVANNTINNNQFIAKTNTEEISYYQSSTDNLLTFGTFDYNIYTRPISETSVMRTDEPLTGTVFRNVSNWSIFSGQDTHSSTSSQTVSTVNDFQFEYNETNVPKNVTLSYDMLDMQGTTYTAGTVTLQPYTSLVLIKKA